MQTCYHCGANMLRHACDFCGRPDAEGEAKRLHKDVRAFLKANRRRHTITTLNAPPALLMEMGVLFRVSGPHYQWTPYGRALAFAA